MELQSIFSPLSESLEFGKTNFGFLAVRVAKSISEHFGGGKLTNRLIEQYILPAFRNDALSPLHDGAIVQQANTRKPGCG